MQHRYLKIALISALLSGVMAPHAEDIDLFVDNPSASDLPNVLFIIDNTANWNQAFTNEISALNSVFASLPVNPDGSAKFNVGIMFATETGSPNNNTSGGYVRAAVRPMNSTNRALYAAMINNFDKLNDKGNGGFSALEMVEAYRYFSGGTPYAGNGKIKTDFAGNTCVGCNLTAAQKTANNAVFALTGNALSAKNSSTYNSPVQPSGCASNFIIYISNGPNQESSTVDGTANTALSAAVAAAGVGDTSTIAISPTGSQSNPSDEWARFMKVSTLGVTTFTIDVDAPTTGQGPGWSRLLKSMADASGGKYTGVNSTLNAGKEISDAIRAALSEILAVNSVFAPASLPIGASSQGAYLNQVYVGMFRPDSDALPRWMGNLKQYKIGLSGGMLRLKDAFDVDAVNTTTGFITECARSFWSSANSYWSFRAQGGCIGATAAITTANRSSDSPDGNVVEKGAQAQQLRATSARSLKTCSPTFASCTALTDFNTGNAAITTALLGAASAAERTALINWARGVDIDDENSNGSTSDMRASAHGDVVHSRPIAFNFGTDASPQVVVFYGGNDGVFRAINGNRSAAIGSVAAGNELWGFVPPEFYSQFKRLRDNSTQINFPNITTGSPLPKPYGIDGPVVVEINGTNAWILAAMRRGGRALYAFNVPVSNPAGVTLKWKVGCPSNFPTSGTVSDTGCTSGFDGIGQTWSTPKTMKAAGYGSGTAPLIIMGGGYDPCEDANPNTCTSSSKGNKVYVLDANTGALQTTFTTDRGVIADVALVPDSAGLIIYAYVADLGGNIYRIDMGTNAPAAWTMTKIASLGCSTTATCAANRKFMMIPDVVAVDSGYVLLVGSGDREKPRLYTNPVTNYFFMLEDRPADATWLSSETANCGSSVLCLNSLFGITTNATPTASDLATKKGWYLGLQASEQVVTAALTIFGTVTFSTHQPILPAPGSCTSNLGKARVYNISYLNAASEDDTSDTDPNDPNPRYQDLPPDIGLPPSPVAGMVTLDDGTTVPFCFGCSPDSPLEAEQPEVPPAAIPVQPKGRVYWYIQH